MIGANSEKERRRLIEGLSLEELKGLQESVAARIGEVEEQMRDQALAELESRAQELGLSRHDLRKHFGGHGGRKRRASGAAKYRHPETGQTWAGTGRRPNWVKAFEARGGRLEDLAVGESAS